MDIQPHLQTIGTTSTGMKPTLHKKPSKTLGRAESRSMYKMPTCYVLGRERRQHDYEANSHKDMASLSWIDKGRGGSPLWWAGPKTYMALVVCSASTAHTGVCHSSPPNIPESTATVSNCMCKRSVHVLFKTLLNFWWRWGFLPAAACRRAGLGSQSSPGSLSLLLATQGVWVDLPGLCMTWCLQTSWASCRHLVCPLEDEEHHPAFLAQPASHLLS